MICDALMKLQEQVAPLSGEKIITVLQDELGKSITELFKEFDEAGCPTAIYPFTTDNQNKLGIMSLLHEAMHEGVLRLMNIPEQRHEFGVFQASQAASGVWVLRAAEGEHDDTVIATALANYGALMGGSIID